MQPNEHVYHGKRDINYLFEKGAKSSPFLLVAFQAVPTVKDGKPVKLYNYTKFLKDINVHRLFIEDTCGEFGCYYLCNNMNFDVEETVIELIESMMAKYKIKRENVIVFGSSKGGSAALYYGFKYGFGHIISGAPQTKIATYLNHCRPEMLQYIVGEDMAKENLTKIDSLLLKQIKPGSTTRLNLLTSEKDAQYKTHIVPLVKALNKAKLDATVVFEPGIEKHRDIATYFPAFLIHHIKRIINEVYRITTPSFEYNYNSFSLTEAKHSAKINTKIQIVSNKGEIIEQMDLASGDYFEFRTDEIMPYSAVHTVCLGSAPLYSTTLCDSIFDQGYFDYNGYSIRFSNSTKELEFKLDVEPKHPISFAFSLVKGKDPIVPTFHSTSASTKFKITDSGTYVVRFAIKVKGKGVLRKSADRFPIAVD
ncbi:MAG: hypothetical protein IKY44_04180 [Clostridia bacterium]|nr:hypothetical protein [Clostridia bacterium]